MSKTYQILIACGGTGGHLFPGIAVAQAMTARGHSVRLLISEKKVDADGSAKYGGLRFETMPAIAKPPTLSPRMVPFLWKLWQSVRRCKRLIRESGTDAVLGMGGFTSLPPVYAAHALGKKSFVHDSNARPGRSNLLTSRFCDRVFVGFDAARQWFAKCPVTVTGTPARPEILNLPTRAEAAARFGLDPARPVILVTGGSQGAHRLNELCAEAATQLPADVQILHIAGNSDFERVQAIASQRQGCKVLGFCDQMAAAYAVADLVIARSGASSLTEISLAGLPSILVPYPFAADDHQTRNAEVFSKVGAAKLVQERDLSAASLAEMVSGILADGQQRAEMAAAARSLAVPDAADRVCDAIIAMLEEAR